MVFHNNYKNNLEKEQKYKFSGYRLGSPTSPMTAKQLTEFSARLNEGMQNIEIGTIQPDLFDTVPTEHLETIKKLAELTDSKVSVHGPIIDPAGFDDKGNWSEYQRKANEQQISHVLERAAKVSTNGNVPVVFHGTAGVFAQQYDKELKNKMPLVDYDQVEEVKDAYGNTVLQPKVIKKDGKIQYRPAIRALGLIDQIQKKVVPVEWEEKYNPGEDKVDIWDPWQKAHSMNANKWEEEKLRLLSYQKEIDELAVRAKALEEQNISINNAGLKDEKEYQAQYMQNARDLGLLNKHMSELDRHIDSGYKELHTHLVIYKPKKETEAYKEYEKKFPEYQKAMAKMKREIKKAAAGAQEASKRGDEEKRREFAQKWAELNEIKKKESLRMLSDLPTPQLIRPVGEFAAEKAAKTFANAMYQFYDRNKDKVPIEKMPILAVENVFPQAPLGRAEELKDAIQQTRKIFAEKLNKKGNVSKAKAKEYADKLIGVTWDVGHINLLRRAGYTEEELKKEVIKETKKIAPVVKHLHLTDNFGFGDTHLPPGEGNVPIREMMEELEKRGFSGRAIVEAGNFVKEFGVSPAHDVLEYFDSPMFKPDTPMYRFGQGPYWQSETFSPYNMSYIEFPQQHFNLYGSSFSTLPKELGGQMGGEKNRFSNTPNA